MAQVLTISLQPWQIPRPKKLSLQHMPYEIRQRIYEFALIEPRLLKKTHESSCIYKRRQTNEVEIPPFFCATAKCEGLFTRQRLATECHCGKRKGLALLRTCRQISHEASPVFWSKNTLQFFSMPDFVQRIGGTLRAEQRNHIRSLSLLFRDFLDVTYLGLPTRSSTIPTWYCEDISSTTQPFWRVVGQCRGLEQLEIPPFALHDVYELDLGNSAACGSDGNEPRLLPGSKLSSVKVTQLIQYRKSPLWESQMYHQPYEKTTVAKCSRTVLLQDVRTLEAVIETRRDLEYNFTRQIYALVRTQFLSATVSHLQNWTATFRLDPGLHQDDNVRYVVLPTGERTKIEFYGLPISKAARVQMAREKMALDMAQREINGLSFAQHEVVQQEKEKKQAVQLRKDTQEHMNYQEILAERRLRRLQLKEERRADAKDRQRNILRATEEAAKVRSKERKRVQPTVNVECAAAP
ncbi:hypothetical protein E4U21_004108 [Claviceps maximensis]|nr:hypothetical protein E4U21_004108 [Claviceps maximensis]